MKTCGRAHKSQWWSHSWEWARWSVFLLSSTLSSEWRIQSLKWETLSSFLWMGSSMLSHPWNGAQWGVDGCFTAVRPIIVFFSVPGMNNKSETGCTGPFWNVCETYLNMSEPNENIMKASRRGKTMGEINQNELLLENELTGMQMICNVQLSRKQKSCRSFSVPLSEQHEA